MGFLAALEREIEEKITCSRRMFAALTLDADDYLTIRKRLRPKAAKKRRIVKKWKNVIRRRMGVEWT